MRRHLLCGPRSLLFGVCPDFSSGVKWPGFEVHHSPRSSAVVKNEWSDTSAPSVCLQDMERDNFTFIVSIYKIQEMEVLDSSETSVNL